LPERQADVLGWPTNSRHGNTMSRSPIDPDQMVPRRYPNDLQSTFIDALAAGSTNNPVCCGLSLS
jgi:hypothetical protein